MKVPSSSSRTFTSSRNTYLFSEMPRKNRVTLAGICIRAIM